MGVPLKFIYSYNLWLIDSNVPERSVQVVLNGTYFLYFLFLVFNPCPCISFLSALGRLYSVMNDLTMGSTVPTSVLKSLKNLRINQPALTVSDLGELS